MENNKVINLDSIDAYNKIYGLTTRHPLVTVIDLKKATRSINNVRINYGVYALFLKNGISCTLKYGRKHYDYQEGSIVSFSPGRVIDVSMDKVETAPDVVGLMFHPDLIYGTPLGDKISSFTFFDYSQMEALHLSEDERAIFLDCLAKIDAELDHPVDHHSASLLSANIQLLLEYLHRFYDRQFITRHKVNSDVVRQFEQRLKKYYESGESVTVMPNVSYFAEQANLSPGYFGDLIRKETGKTPKEIITLHMIGVAKQRLAASAEDVSLIAYSLGFDYPAHFSRMFKRVTGQTPSAYRESLNLN
ncbi:AraC family transcriptional regulator [uncultured Duncaniella sp.]|uniref:helix-turn-helix domain-containing protein n=1 Tax=uncultured Duncaniella sp. TaxID=2768039 RepID=UPI0025FD124C|nr:AraC family transcriptional regulator [uncultured Duncaniella sp.]